MSGSAFAVTHHAFSSGAGRTSDGNGSHASTLKSPSYTKSVSWQHYQSGFDLPGEDEWEYLCGGGSRTLWRWGNSFNYKMKIPFITSEEPTTWDIEWPNQFGLKIAFNPYLQEIINDKDTLLKGGDGGCNLCGGANIALRFLPVATYYKGYNKHTDELDYINDIGGNYTSYRRIIRL